MYRFGDGTPFPLQDNFIDTLLAAIDACVGSFGAAAEIDERREKTRAARKDTEEELRRLALLDKAVEGAVMPMKPSTDKTATHTSLVAARALTAARVAIGGGRAILEQRLQQLAAEPRVEPALERLRASMALFFEHHQLPDTVWRWQWSATRERVAGDAVATAGRFRAGFELACNGPWTGVVRVAAIAPHLTGVVLKKKMFGGMKRAHVSLDKMGIVAVEHGPERQAMVLREHFARPSPGWRIVVRDSDKTGTTLVPVDLSGRGVGHEIVLEGEDATPYLRLWEAIECDLLEILEDRRRMRDLQIGDTQLDQVTEPAMVARALLGVLGPLVRQIRTRSRVVGELAIKRDVGDGRREELYVPRIDVERRFATLPAIYKKAFEEIGLGRGPTAELVSGDKDEPVTIPEVTARPHTLGKLPAVPPTPPPQLALRAAS